MTSTAGLRARVRAELVQEIKNEARRQLAEAGASSLSLRAVARELGMVSSGIYRYYKSRDQLLTALIIDAYEAIGAAVEAADARCERTDLSARWSACCHAVRSWALAYPQEYALIYGSPVPGYRAPENTTTPASRVVLALAAVVREAAAADGLRDPFRPECVPELSKGARTEAARLQALGLAGVPEEAIVRAIVAWTQLFGLVSFEIFGRLVDVVDDIAAMFEQSVTEMGAFVGLIHS
jgi:AcrR family transcriptional regulator